ncbi:hypothetical protein KKA14_04040, partial [bacterium]|nr:hypothetical protein [bacterium]
MELKMKKSFIYSLIVLIGLFLVSCSQQTRKLEDTVYLDELEKQKQLEASQQSANAQIVEDYDKKKKILTRVEAEDRIEQKKLVKKQEDIKAKSAQLDREIEEKTGSKSAEIARNNKKVPELLAMNLPPEELEKRLSEETALTKEEIAEVVKTYKLQRMIASSQTKEKLEQVLKEKTELKTDEIERIVAIKQQVLDTEKELRKETLKKIHDRLIRNRQLNLETVFCSGASKLDQLILKQIYYPFDVHTVDNESSSQLFNEYELISQELSNYPDMMLQLEGSCDHKGSNKYNKALGDRRWSGVVPLLTSIGYSNANIRGISKGEECQTPKITDDESWRAQNRRTDFVWTLK